MPNQNIAFVILNYKEYTLAEDVVARLNSFGYAETIIVVDNASGNESAEVLGALAAKGKCTFIASGENGGYAKGNNLGLRKARDMGCEYALVLNSDVVIGDGQSILAMAEALQEDEKTACVCPRIMEADGSETAQRFLRPTAWDMSLGIFGFEAKMRKKMQVVEGVTPIYRAHGCCLLLRLAAMEEIGYMDERTFLYFEESILAERLEAAGWQSVFQPGASVLHNHSVVAKKVLKVWPMVKIYAASCRLYLQKYRKFGPLRLLLCTSVLSLSVAYRWAKG